ncbi:MAG: RNA-binding protein, partial [Nostoc sp.]
EQAPKPVTLASSSTPIPSPTRGEGSRREKSSKKPRRGSSGGGGSRETSTTTTDSDAIRPDPRWASELEKLKQMLAAQTTN